MSSLMRRVILAHLPNLFFLDSIGNIHMAQGDENGHRRAGKEVHSDSNQEPGAGDYGTFQVATYAGPREIPNTGIRAGEIRAYRGWYFVKRDNVVCVRSMIWPYYWDYDAPAVGNPLKVPEGIYAFKDPAYAVQDLQGHIGNVLTGQKVLFVVLGQVDLWGDIVEYSKGYRAQYARIASFDKIFPAEPEVLKELNEHYNPTKLMLPKAS